MKLIFYTYILILLSFVFTTTANAFNIDSIGRRIENGKVVVLHKVESKQTVYAIAKLYSVEPATIYHDNPTAKESLKVGQILKVNTGRAENEPAPIPKENIILVEQGKTHTVEPKQTLYAISKIYNVLVDDIKKWNNLTSNELSTGQILKINESNTIVSNSTPSKINTNEKTHVVQPKETLYAISKLYNVSVEDIKKWNNLTSNELSTNQTIIVSGIQSKPVVVTTSTPVKSTSNNNNFNPNSQFHTVEKGETLFGLSKKYNVEINDLAAWNNLTSNSLTEGQLLIINGVPESSSSSAMNALNAVNTEEKNQYATTNKSNNTVNKNNTTSSNTKLIDQYKVDENHEEKRKVEEALALSQQHLDDHSVKKQEYVQSAPTTNTSGDRDHWKIPSNLKTYEDTVKYGVRSRRTNVGEYKKIVETGICELITDNHWDTKYNALHATADKGTIIQVRNPENNISVFVRVVGRLVETSENKGDVIKISHHAVERLAPDRTRFPVEISYLP